MLHWKRTNLELAEALHQRLGHCRGSLLKLAPQRADESQVAPHPDRYFHHYPIQGSRSLNSTQIDPLLEALVASLRRSNGRNSERFRPEYGLKVEGPGGSLEVVISFQDYQLFAYGRGRPQQGLLLGGQQVFASSTL